MKMAFVKRKLLRSSESDFQPGYVFDDGGRKAAGHRGREADCAVRATAIVLGLDYDTTLEIVLEKQLEWQSEVMQNSVFSRWVAERSTCTPRSDQSAVLKEHMMVTKGVPAVVIRSLYRDMGFEYRSTWLKGLFVSNYGDLLNYGLLPHEGLLILHLRGHLSAVIDGVIHDNFDTRNDVVRGAYIVEAH